MTNIKEFMSTIVADVLLGFFIILVTTGMFSMFTNLVQFLINHEFVSETVGQDVYVAIVFLGICGLVGAIFRKG